MLNMNKLAAAALVVASMVPFAAKARSGPVSYNQTHSAVQSAPMAQVQNAPQGRANELNTNGYSVLTDTSQYATVQGQPAANTNG